MKKVLFVLSLAVWSQFALAGSLADVVAASKDLEVKKLPDGRKVLAAANGLTLYTFDNDTNGETTCFKACLALWPAMTTEEESVDEPFSIQTRSDDSTSQISLDNQPLYFFAKDKVRSDIKGDGLGDVWHIIEIE